MQLDRKELCPLLKKKCVKLDCAWFVKMTGTDPQDKTKEIEAWDCAIVWNLKVGLEVAKRVEGGADGIQKAHESFRNEFVKAAQIASGVAPVLIEQR